MDVHIQGQSLRSVLFTQQTSPPQGYRDPATAPTHLSWPSRTDQWQSRRRPETVTRLGKKAYVSLKGHLLLGLSAVCCPHLRSHRCWWLHVMWIPQSSCVPLDLCYKVGSYPKGRQVWGSSPQEAVSPPLLPSRGSRTSYNGRCKETGQHKGGDILDPNSVTSIAKLKNSLLN